MTQFLIPLSFWLSLLATISAQTAPGSDICYLPNGDAFDNGDISSSHKPCTSSGLSTICCALNRQNPPGGDSKFGVTRDECLPNGLCQNRMVTNGVETTTFWANYCTDRDFDSGNCLNICKQSRNAMGYTAMTSCNGRADSEKWCCGANSACCTTGIGLVTLPQNFTVRAVANTTAGLKVSTSPISSPTTPPSPSSSVISSMNNSQLSGGAIAGIVIGTLAGFSILSAIIFLALRRRSKKMLEAESYQKGDVIAPYYFSTQGDHSYGELNSQNEKYELPQKAMQELQQPPCELPGQTSSEIQRQPDIRIVSPHGSSALI